jgi:hypothetical protein
MKTRYRRVPAEFGPETRFEIKPTPPAPFRAVQENEFERLKISMLGKQLQNLWNPELTAQVRRAANEAAALAWVTPYPLLVFPVLFEERAEATLKGRGWQERIPQIRQPVCVP